MEPIYPNVAKNWYAAAEGKYDPERVFSETKDLLKYLKVLEKEGNIELINLICDPILKDFNARGTGECEFFAKWMGEQTTIEEGKTRGACAVFHKLFKCMTRVKDESRIFYNKYDNEVDPAIWSIAWIDEIAFDYFKKNEMRKQERKEMQEYDLKNFPIDVRNNLLECCDVLTINKMMRLNKSWHELINDNQTFMYQRIINYSRLDRLVYNSCKKNAETKLLNPIKSSIQMMFPQFFNRILLWNCPLVNHFNDTIYNEIQALFKNAQLENINELITLFSDINKAYKILVLCEMLKDELKRSGLNVIGEKITINKIDTIKEIFYIAKGFQNWLRTNQDNLSLLKTVGGQDYLTSFGKCLISSEAIKFLKNLETFDISYSLNFSLPFEICQLINLKKLHVSANRLTSLPNEIGNLTNLEHLDLCSNQLTCLPDSFWKLTNLVYLDLMGNELTRISPKIGRFTKLKTLHLLLNPLISLPKILGHHQCYNRGLSLSVGEKNEDPSFWNDEKDEELKICAIQ